MESSERFCRSRLQKRDEGLCKPATHLTDISDLNRYDKALEDPDRAILTSIRVCAGTCCLIMRLGRHGKGTVYLVPPSPCITARRTGRWPGLARRCGKRPAARPRTGNRERDYFGLAFFESAQASHAHPPAYGRALEVTLSRPRARVACLVQRGLVQPRDAVIVPFPDMH